MNRVLYEGSTLNEQSLTGLLSTAVREHCNNQTAVCIVSTQLISELFLSEGLDGIAVFDQIALHEWTSDKGHFVKLGPGGYNFFISDVAKIKELTISSKDKRAVLKQQMLNKELYKATVKELADAFPHITKTEAIPWMSSINGDFTKAWLKTHGWDPKMSPAENGVFFLTRIYAASENSIN